MQLSDLLDDVIASEVYKGVRIRCKIYHDLSQLPPDTVDGIKSDSRVREDCKGKLTQKLQKFCYRDLVVTDLDPSSNSVEIEYTAYYTGSKQYPEVHLKTLLIYYDNRGVDVRDSTVFDRIVEEVRRDLGDKYRDCKEKRLNHFASLFKKALAEQDYRKQQ